MPSDFRLPPIGFGPGSQPSAADGEELSYMAMPKDMAVYLPHTPEVDDPKAVGPRADAPARHRRGLRRGRKGRIANFDLRPLDAENRALVADTLGEGEVSARIRGIPATAVQETRFAGVWVLTGADQDTIEVAAIPDAVRARAFTALRPGKGPDAPRSPAVINAPPIYAELADKAAQRHNARATPHMW
jgi:hydrogenase-1 operon protein HyaF